MKLYSLIILLICFLNLLKNGECGNGGNEDGNKGDGDQNKEDKKGKRVIKNILFKILSRFTF